MLTCVIVVVSVVETVSRIFSVYCVNWCKDLSNKDIHDSNLCVSVLGRLIAAILSSLLSLTGPMKNINPIVLQVVAHVWVAAVMSNEEDMYIINEMQANKR